MGLDFDDGYKINYTVRSVHGINFKAVAKAGKAMRPPRSQNYLPDRATDFIYKVEAGIQLATTTINYSPPVQAGCPGSSEVPRNPLTRWDVSSIPANGIFLTKELKNKIKMPNEWRTIKSLVPEIRLHSRQGK